MACKPRGVNKKVFVPLAAGQNRRNCTNASQADQSFLIQVRLPSFAEFCPLRSCGLERRLCSWQILLTGDTVADPHCTQIANREVRLQPGSAYMAR
jgi:hypothetical protein